MLIAYYKRNGAFVYNSGQSDILVRLLEIVFKKESAFWLYAALLENVLPLNYFKNSLYPQALLDFTFKLMKD